MELRMKGGGQPCFRGYNRWISSFGRRVCATWAWASHCVGLRVVVLRRHLSSGSPQSAATLQVSLLFSAIGLLILAFRPHRRTPLTPLVVLAAAIVVSTTTLLFFVAPVGAALLAISALGGVASAVLWIAWGELFCQVDLEITEACIPASLGVFVGAVLLTYLLPHPFSGYWRPCFPGV